MRYSVNNLEQQIAEQEKEIAYYKRILNDVSNRNLRELEEVSKVASLLKENEQFQADLHRAKRMEAVGLMAGGVAHDLNNILSGIINYPELILLNLPEDSDLRAPLRRIKESGQHAALVVADLLTIARGVASPKDIYDLNEIVNEYIHSPQHESLVSRFTHISCEIVKNSTPLYISCSSVHVTKCIMNLVCNAAEAIEGKGRILLRTLRKCLDFDTKKLKRGEYVILQVVDNGHGIPQDSLRQIFEPFYTKKIMGRSGTGLGLSVVWNTIQDHNGHVEVTSGENGTCFNLYFPASSMNIEKGSTIAANNQLSGHGTILVVDDEEIQRDIASEILTHLKYHVTTVASGEEAVNYLRSNPVDLVILDMIMGKGMNGLETYKSLSKIKSNQKALIASGFSESKHVEETCNLGAGGFIKKPYTIGELGLAVKKVLNKGDSVP